MNKNKLISMKRIEKDINEIRKHPIKGIGIIQYENDFMKYIVNLQLLNGIYEGYCLQLLLTFTEYYPVKPPKILIFPNQSFDNSYHHHIFNDAEGFKKFCFDLLDNDFLNINEKNTGWNPSYSISSLLLQVQNFLSDPDFGPYHIMSDYKIKYLFDSMNNYVKIFKNENGEEIVHTWENPYPSIFGYEKDKKTKEKENDDIKTSPLVDIREFTEKLYNHYVSNKNNNNNINNGSNLLNYSPNMSTFVPFLDLLKKDTKDDLINNEEINFEEKKIIEENEIIDYIKEEIIIKIISKIEQEKLKEEQERQKKLEQERQAKAKKLEEIKQNLTCFLLRVNIIDDKDICLGYPLKQIEALGNKIECVPIPEILSYEGYISQIAKQDGKLDDYFNVKFKAGNNDYYNYWLPIYINEEHFQRNKVLILNSFSVLKFGARGQKEYDFKPEHIFEYLPNLLNKMVCAMFNEKSYMSEAYIRCYFQYLLLFKKLIQEFKQEFDKYLNEILNLIVKYKYVVNKTSVPDLGNLYMLLYFSDNEIDDKIWKVLFEESIIRKMYWTFHFEGNENKCRNIFNNYDFNSYDLGKKLMDLMKKQNLFYYEFLEDFKGDKIYQKEKIECLFSNKEIKSENNNDNNSNNIIINPKKGLFNECIEKNIFEKIVEIIAKEYSKKPKSLNDLFSNKKKNKKKIDEKTKNEIKNKLIDEFPYLYKNICSSTSQNKIDDLLLKNINLYKYCAQDLKNNELEPEDYLSTNQVDTLLEKIDKKHHLEIVYKLYDVSKDNLLLITTLAQMKMNQKGFLSNLEQNYGVYMNIEDLMKEINQKIKDVKCYKDLFDFMKADVVFKLEDEYNSIIKSYQKAKEKKYIRTIVAKPKFDMVLMTASDFKVNVKKNNNDKPLNNTNNKYNNNRNNNNNHNRNNHRNNNRHYRNENNRRTINNYNSGNNNNANTINNNSNNNRKRKNFNSHMADLDEMLGD